MTDKKRVLVIRNDKIGDFMLAWPSFAMLKQSYPECHITALVPAYTSPLANACPWIDDVLLDPTGKANKEVQQALLETIKAQNFDAVISLFSNTYNALLVWRANIPYRLAPATKLAQVLYNQRLLQRRSRSEKEEYQYNMDLVRRFLTDHDKTPIEPQTPYFSLKDNDLAAQKRKLADLLGISENKAWCFVHTGSGGSANNLSLQQYAELVDGLSGDIEVILTAGPGEALAAEKLAKLIERTTTLYTSNDGLLDFFSSIACANLFIAGSTGPLHMAATLDVPTVGFFPSKRSATPLRWRPINSEDRHLAFCPPKQGSEKQQEDMTQIQVSHILDEINAWSAPFLSESKDLRI